MERFHDQGRDCYKRKEYKKALECFNRAIGRGQSVQLLDNRSACHDKLGDLPAALKDAKATIQLQREDPTGYLRAGKVLVKMDKPSVALEIYTHGLKSIKHVGQGYELLRKGHKEILNQLSPPKSVDPLTVLPRELAEYVLEYLSFRQRMNACLVSKQWADFIRATPNLWQHLDLTGARRRVRNAFISRAINTCRQRLTAATLTNVYDIDKALTALFRHCPLSDLTLVETGLLNGNLATTISNAKSLKSLRICAGTEINWRSLERILTTCATTLESLECRQVTKLMPDHLRDFQCNNLATLVLINISSAPFFHHDFAARFPSLTTLKLRCFWDQQYHMDGLMDLAKHHKLAHLDIEDGFPRVTQFKLPLSLRTLALRHTGSHNRVFVPTAPMEPRYIPHRLPHLEELAIGITEEVLDLVVALLHDVGGGSSGPLSSLRRLSLQAMTFDSECLEAIFRHPRLGRLSHLDTDFLDLCDDDVARIAPQLAKLQTWDLSRTRITGVSVRTIVRHGQGHLKKLILHDCRTLSVDAIEWARSQDVQVDYRMTDSSGGGRKVRH